MKECEEDLKGRLENESFMQTCFQKEDWKEDLSDANEWKKISEKHWLIALKKPLDEDMHKLYLTIPEDTRMRLYDICTGIMMNEMREKEEVEQQERDRAAESKRTWAALSATGTSSKVKEGRTAFKQTGYRYAETEIRRKVESTQWDLLSSREQMKEAQADEAPVSADELSTFPRIADWQTCEYANDVKQALVSAGLARGPTTADYEMVELQAIQPQHIIDGGQDVVKATKIDGKLVFTDEFLSAEIIVASFGLHNFENSKYSEKKSHAVFDHYRRRGRKGRSMQNPSFHALEEKSLFEKVDKSFRANYSSLIGKPTREICYIDCTGLRDPSDHKHLYGHRGSHPDILAGIMNAKDLQYVMAQVVKCLSMHKDGKRMLVVTICKSGRHRSVGLKEMVTYALRKYIYCGADKIGAIDLQNQSDWGHMCCYKDGYPKRCERCDYDRGYRASLDRKHWMYRSFYMKMVEEARRQKEARSLISFSLRRA